MKLHVAPVFLLFAVLIAFMTIPAPVFAVMPAVEISPSELSAEPPLQVLMITGGGWHDYDTQRQILESEIGSRANVAFTVDYEGGDDADAMITRHEDTDWASEFDLVLYNMCYSGVEDVSWIEQIADAHVENQLPAVMLHCAIHSYRGDTMRWFEFAGARSHRHESHQPYTVENMNTGHPVMTHFPGSWRTPEGELYEIPELMTGSKPLARAYGVDTDLFHPVAWIREDEGVRVFNTTIGHHNSTMGHDVNLNMVTAGLLWAAGKLQEDGSPEPGYEGERELGWISIWDGETLDGWRASENTESFQVEDGKIVVDGPRSHLFYEGPVDGGDFINFEFKADVYTYPEANSGVFFHTRFQEEGWPQHGYEAQVNATHGDRRKTGSLYAVEDVMDDAPHEDHEWFHYHIIVNGRDITFRVDDETVMQYTEPEDREGTISLDRGTIALQAHDPNSRIYFRNLMIRPLPD